MEEITRPAVITAINGDEVKLRVKCRSACSSCAAKSFCGMSEAQDKEITAVRPPAEKFAVGEEAEVVIPSGQGLQAVFYAYVLPLVLFVAVIVLLKALGFGDFSSGISGIIVLIPYYFGLFLVQRKLKNNFRLTIVKISSERKDTADE